MENNRNNNLLVLMENNRIQVHTFAWDATFPFPEHSTEKVTSHTLHFAA